MQIMPRRIFSHLLASAVESSLDGVSREKETEREREREREEKGSKFVVAAEEFEYFRKAQ